MYLLYCWHRKNGGKSQSAKNAKRSLRLLFMFMLARTHFALPASGIIHQDSSIYSWHGDIIWEFWRELRDHLLLCLNVWWEIQFFGRDQWKEKKNRKKKKALSTYCCYWAYQVFGCNFNCVYFKKSLSQVITLVHKKLIVLPLEFCIHVPRLKDRRDVCALPGAVSPPASPLWANVALQERCGKITAEPQWDMSYGALNERAVPHWAL